MPMVLDCSLPIHHPSQLRLLFESRQPRSMQRDDMTNVTSNIPGHTRERRRYLIGPRVRKTDSARIWLGNGEGRQNVFVIASVGQHPSRHAVL
jgi:hypothetical protein